MKVIEHDTCIEYYPYDDNFYSVTCYKPRELIMGTGFGDAAVSWGCHGAETPERAKLYAEAIIEASKMAEKLNKDILKTS